MNTIKKFIALATLSLAMLATIKPVSAHCEIPCGIYDDSVRIALIYEHISTIEKSMLMIKQLEAAETIDYNQMVRWVMNKEEHAKKIQEIATQYFMYQRVKPIDETDKEHYKRYIEMLSSLHQITVFAMKTKQTTDEGYIKKLRETVHQFEHEYFEGHTH